MSKLALIQTSDKKSIPEKENDLLVTNFNCNLLPDVAQFLSHLHYMLHGVFLILFLHQHGQISNQWITWKKNQVYSGGDL